MAPINFFYIQNVTSPPPLLLIKIIFLLISDSKNEEKNSGEMFKIKVKKWTEKTIKKT